MSSNAYETLEAVYDALRADATIISLVSTRVFTYVPSSTQYPYILISGPETTTRHTKDTPGYDHEIQINYYSRKSSPVEVHQIKDAIINLLDRDANSISIDSGSIVDINLSAAPAPLLAPDGKTREGMVSFTLFVQ